MSRQIHGKTLIDLRAENAVHACRGPLVMDENGLPQADAQVTSVLGQVVAVRTADCLPVIVADRQRRQVGAIHGGWRGLTAGILREGVAAFADRGISLQELVAVIGPAISRESYEVGPDVVQAVLSPTFGLGERAALLSLAKGQGDRWHFDLAVAAALHLIQLGLKPENIEVIQACTFREGAFNSFRRDRQTRQLNWSWIRL